MKMQARFTGGKKGSMILAALMLLGASAVLAQDPQQNPPSDDKPKPAAKAYGPIGAEDQDPNQSPEVMQADNRPLTGIQEPTVGSPMERHSYWVPGVSYYNFIQSNGQTQGGGSGWSSTNYLSGNVSLLENWSRSQLMVNYSGGGILTTSSGVGNSWYQQLGATQTFNWERWQLTLLDDFSYLPQAQFGFGNGTGLSLPGIGGSLGAGSTGLGGSFNPGTSIFSAIGPRYTNAFGAQTNYLISPRASITLGGVYSLLRFTESGNIESNDYAANAGFNYQVSRTDTLGVVYRFNAFHFIGFPQAIGDHTIQAVYGRKITGRLALQLGGGPEITNFKFAQAGGTKTRYIGGSANVSVSYAVPKGTFGLGYTHGVTAGSGVFFGATTDQVTVSGTRRLSRVWTGDAHVGFAHNSNTETASGVPNPSFNTIYAGGSVARPLGRNASVSLGYTLYHETSANVGGFSFTTHQISLGVNWHTRPFVLR
jgi:hypothetical protein